MKPILILILIVAIGLGCKEKKENLQEKDSDSMAESEKQLPPGQEKWTVLFDGTSFEEWKGYLMDEVPAAWKIEDGAMVLYPSKDSENEERFNLVSKKDYTNFVLSLEWKISEAGNSGIFWGINEDDKLHEPYETGPEIQVLDNEKHPDAKAGTTHRAGALYDMVAPSKDVTKAVGEWNECVITINQKTNKASVVLNGVEIVTFSPNGEDWDAMVSKSKFADWESFGKYTTGKIGLQDHGDKVWYRNIKIKEL